MNIAISSIPLTSKEPRCLIVYSWDAFKVLRSRSRYTQLLHHETNRLNAIGFFQAAVKGSKERKRIDAGLFTRLAILIGKWQTSRFLIEYL